MKGLVGARRNLLASHSHCVHHQLECRDHRDYADDSDDYHPTDHCGDGHDDNDYYDHQHDDHRNRVFHNRYNYPCSLGDKNVR